MRLVWVILNVVFWTGLAGILAIIVGLIDRSGRAIWWIARGWSWILLKISGVPYRLTGREYLQEGQEYVFAANHESAYDIPLCFVAIPRLIVPIAKVELKRIPVFGWAMVMARHIFVDRGNHNRALESLERTKQSLIKNPRSILVYPEGTRSLDGRIHRFKKGGVVLAIKLGIPIVPVAVCGTSQVITKHSWTIRPRLIELRLGEPFVTEELSYDDRNRVTEELQARVEALKTEWAAEEERNA